MSNTASEDFRACFADLNKVLQDHDLLPLALELYSAGVVSRSVLVERLEKSWLLFEVGDTIDVNPAKFQNFLQVLRKQPRLKEVSNKLETTYKNCGM